MGPDEIAAIAALAVALVALVVTSAQAVQQYFISGKLIRLCDSVVYNRMPGQGHRIWQFSQFRFRVVYSIPQIRLTPDLWLPTAMHVQSLPPEAVRLPQLSATDAKSKPPTLAGEASWVSFIRAVQSSSGESLRYTMIEGDADRCPSDLPVVPIQLSLRDVIALGIMAGMECTDFSFQAQSISMQGDAGTITSSRHPVLGTLLHFALKQKFENHGAHSLGGRIHPDWVARMMDVVTVAGQRLDSRDRKRFEEDEGTWIKASNDQSSMQDVTPVQTTASTPSSTLRQRRPIKSPSLVNGNRKASTGLPLSYPTSEPRSIKVPNTSTPIHRRAQDGDWSLELSPDAQRNGDDSQHQSPTMIKDSLGVPKNDVQNSVPWMSRIHRVFTQAVTQRHRNLLPVVEPKESSNPIAHVYAMTSHEPREKQILAIKNHSEEDEPTSTGDRSSKKSKRDQDHPHLMLTNGDTQGGPIPSSLHSPLEIIDLQHSKERSDFVMKKWQQAFQRRRRERSRGRLQQSRSKNQLLLKGIPTSDRRQSSSTQRRAIRESQELSRHPRLAIKERVPTESSVHPTQELDTVNRVNQSKEQPVMPKDRQWTRWSQRSSNEDMSLVNFSTSSSPSTGSVGSVEYWTRDENMRRRTSSSSAEEKGVDPYVSESEEDITIRRGRRRNSSLTRDQAFSKNVDSAKDSDNEHSSGGQSDSTDNDSDSEHPNQDQIEEGARISSPAEVSPRSRPRLQYRQILNQILSGSDLNDTSNLDELSVLSSSNSSLGVQHQEQDHLDTGVIMKDDDQAADAFNSGNVQKHELNGAPGPSQSLSKAGVSTSEDDKIVKPYPITRPRMPPPPPRPILRRPRERFPEDPSPVREGVAPLGLAREIPVDARWTRIDRRLVSPEALEAGNERFEKRRDHLIVLRVLTKEEIQSYVTKTQEIREARVRDRNTSPIVSEGTSESQQDKEQTMKKNFKSGQERVGVNDTHVKKAQKKKRPTWIKVHRKYLSWRTLDAFDLPWEWDSGDGDFMIIKRWVDEGDQERLYEHTRDMRERRLQSRDTVFDSGESPIHRRKFRHRIGQLDNSSDASETDDVMEEDDINRDDTSQRSGSSEASFERNRPQSPDLDEDPPIQDTSTVHGPTKVEWLLEHQGPEIDQRSIHSEVESIARVSNADSGHSPVTKSANASERKQAQPTSNTVDEKISRTDGQGTTSGSPRVQSGSFLQHGVPLQPNPTRQRVSSPKHRLLSDDQIMTYDEEKLFNHSASILKGLKKCTEHCKDVITTLQFCIDVQPDVDSSILEIFEVTNECNTSLKGLLLIIDPISNVRKISEIVTADLEVLLHGLQAGLKTIQHSFDHIDIVPMDPDERKTKWRETLSGYEDKHACSLLDNLTVAQRFQEEVTSNLKLGLYKSTESAMWKRRLARTSGYQDLRTVSTISPVENIGNTGFMGQGFKRSMFLSPSRYVQSPNRSSTRESPPRQLPRRTQRRSDSQRQKSPSMEDENMGRDLVIRGTRKRESFADDVSSSSSTLTSSETSITGEMNWFWISQIDILPGYFATPWKPLFPITTSLGAISVLLKTLERYTNTSNLLYVPDFPECKLWLQAGKTTYPSYAHNANGGVVVSGTYEPVTFNGFETTLTPIKLLGSFEAQIDPIYRPTTSSTIDSITELMYLDTWLSLSGRSREISSSPRRLLYSLPTLIQQIMQTFDLEFSSVDRASKGGGGRIVRTISNSLVLFLKEQGLRKAEQLFALVGLLRSVKVAVAVGRGVDTRGLRDVLVNDLQVWLA